jgi:transcriptional regulator with XRE-family HTH domain
MIMYSSIVDNDELADYEGPLLVAAGTPGNRRFGALVKNLRERSSLSPQELAEQADVHVSFVRGIERGAQAPSMATAHPLLACMKEQHRIHWIDSGPYDLLVRDSGTGRDVAFEFKAKVKGQNRRTDVGPIANAMLEVLVPAMQQLRDELGIGQPVGETREPRAEVVGHAGDGQPRWSTPADDAALGSVIRLLASADEEMLARVESLLRDELGPGQSGF